MPDEISINKIDAERMNRKQHVDICKIGLPVVCFAHVFKCRLFILVSLIVSNADIRHLVDSLVAVLAVYATAFGSKRSLAPKTTDMK